MNRPENYGLLGLTFALISLVMIVSPRHAWHPALIRRFGPPGLGTRLAGALLLPAALFMFLAADPI